MKSHLIITPINPRGYEMNPLKDVLELARRKYPDEVITLNFHNRSAYSLAQIYQYKILFDNTGYCIMSASAYEGRDELMVIVGEENDFCHSWS